MDVESPQHLERLRDQPEIKVALLRLQPLRTSSEARFERAPKNTSYWPLVEELSERLLQTGRAAEIRESREVYGRPCWLLATSLMQLPNAPYTVAVAAADGADVEALVALLQSVCDDYWNGSSFFK